MTPLQPAKISIYQTFEQIILIICKAAPFELASLIFLSVITGSGPSVSLFFNKIVVDELIQITVKKSPDAFNTLLSEPKLLSSLALMLIVNILVDALKPAANIMSPTLKEAVEGFIKSKVISKVAQFNDLALFETPYLLNILKLAERGMKDIPEFMYLVVEVIIGMFILIPSVALSFSISWWIPVLLILSSIPSQIVSTTYTKKSWSIEETQADSIRLLDIYTSLMLSETYAKEIRLFSLEYLLIEKWKSVYYSLYQKMRKLRLQGAILSFFWSLLEGIGIVIPYIYIIIGVIKGSYSIGDLALYSGLILQIRIGMRLALNSFNSIYSIALSVRPIFYLLSLEPSIVNETQYIFDNNGIQSSDQGIQIKGLTFTYPGGDRPTLNDINLNILPGEMLVLVGENGAGKTTLAKLLCRFYDPQQGQIIWNGRDLKSLSLTDLRSHLAVVMQDYAHFPANLRENVGWGYLPKSADNPAIQAALQKVGMMSLIDSLDKGLETPLSRQFEHGIDLSGGQWQRIAIARALLRLSEAELVIFDEPTAAIDPKNEHDIYEILRGITKERMSVVISHRLGLAKIADRVIVMEHGRIVEEGSHEELMLQGGRYHTMFTRQMSYYQ
ncbi:ABC transporter ATP-binding protein [Chamaesiphon sp.]|uniref:ABC transporter ATP-binding protein n=1 Tax=Chamaesiphon sp. TaxID=2814140 RepID=UPI003592E854